MCFPLTNPVRTVPSAQPGSRISAKIQRQVSPREWQTGAAAAPISSVPARIATLFQRAWSLSFEGTMRSEEHTSELQSLMRISYAVFCLKKKKHTDNKATIDTRQYT